ncbi:hypothetical protein [Carboxylicivirga sp. N1Y90]|uniref:hypothetical protein n=1 Tax=Carboxylicivirga fragile TaxID=3417571 RepID=UPI003D328D4E|nr:hypothetical protein [Marinilabiliaceae bacterium N1Y90]
MRKYTLLIIVVNLFFAVTSCVSKVEKVDKLGKIEVEIPAELEGNKEIVAYVDGMTEVANNYAEIIDDVMEDVGEFAGMDESELGMMDQLKLVKATGEVTLKSAEVMGQWLEYTDKRIDLGKQLSEAELKALDDVWKQFEDRMEEIQNKFDSEIANKTES